MCVSCRQLGFLDHAGSGWSTHVHMKCAGRAPIVCFCDSDARKCRLPTSKCCNTSILSRTKSWMRRLSWLPRTRPCASNFAKRGPHCLDRVQESSFGRYGTSSSAVVDRQPVRRGPVLLCSLHGNAGTKRRGMFDLCSHFSLHFRCVRTIGWMYALVVVVRRWVAEIGRSACEEVAAKRSYWDNGGMN